jgi:hypothetical protein
MEHWKTLTFLAALRPDLIDAPLVLDGPINAKSFAAYIEQMLVPTLSPGDIVINQLCQAAIIEACNAVFVGIALAVCGLKPGLAA